LVTINKRTTAINREGKHRIDFRNGGNIWKLSVLGGEREAKDGEGGAIPGEIRIGNFKIKEIA